MALAQNITVIPAKRMIGTQRPDKKVQKIRVAAYCRVSTEYEEQESSYEVQVEHYTNYINANPEWELAGVYADDGISATNTAKRDAFNRMIEDCRAGKIDMILTKSISRFSRNTVDCLKYTRELKTLNIAVFFEKENINTLDAKGGSAHDDHGSAGPAGIRVIVGKRKAWHSVQKSGRKGTGES